jgi:hypothetical protein
MNGSSRSDSRKNGRRRNGRRRNGRRRNGRRRNGRRRNGRRRKVMIRGVFVYFEILARSPRIRVRSAEVCFYNTFTVNSTTNRLINMHSIGV